jgi:hypothetical protein
MEACCGSSVDAGDPNLRECAELLLGARWRSFPEDALPAPDGDGSDDDVDDSWFMEEEKTPRRRRVRKLQRSLVEEAVPFGWVVHRVLPQGGGPAGPAGAKRSRDGGVRGVVPPQGSDGAVAAAVAVAVAVDLGQALPRVKRGPMPYLDHTRTSDGGADQGHVLDSAREQWQAWDDREVGSCGDVLSASLIPAIRPAAASIGSCGVVVCGGLLPAGARELDGTELAFEVAAAAAASGEPLQHWEQGGAASRAYSVLPPRPSSQVALLVAGRTAEIPERADVTATDGQQRETRTVHMRGLHISAEPAPLPAGSHGGSLVAEIAHHCPYGSDGWRIRPTRRAVLFGGRVAHGATPSARELLLDPAAARDDATQGLTNALRVIWLSDEMVSDGKGVPPTIKRMRTFDGNEQSGDVPCPRELHSAAFARAPLRSELRKEDEAIALMATRACREELTEDQTCCWWREYLAAGVDGMGNEMEYDGREHQGRCAADGDWSPLELAVAYEGEMAARGVTTWRRAWRRRPGGRQLTDEHDDDGDGGAGFRRMYVFGGVRYASVAVPGAVPAAFCRVPADAQAGTLYACSIFPESSGRAPLWKRLSTRAAPGQPPDAVPNTTTLLAFFCEPMGDALYAIPDRVVGGGGAPSSSSSSFSSSSSSSSRGGSSHYRLHRLDLADLTWRLVPIVSGGGVGVGGGGSVDCPGPEPRFGSAAVFMPPAEAHVRYSGGKLVVYGGRAPEQTQRQRQQQQQQPRPAAAATAAPLHVLHLPPDSAFAAKGTLAHGAHLAARAGVASHDWQHSRLRERTAALGGDEALAWSSAWWEAVTPDLYLPPGAREDGEAGQSPMLPLYLHAGAAIGDPFGYTAAVFVGGCDARAPSRPSAAWQVLRWSVARPPGAPPGGSSVQRATQHMRRELALMLRRRQQEAGTRLRRRPVTLRAASEGEGSPGYTIDAQLLSLYSEMFDSMFQDLLGGDDEDDEDGDGADDKKEGRDDEKQPPVLPLPVPSDAALRNLLLWTQGRLSVWALTCCELFDLYVAADAMVVTALMREARQQLLANVTSVRAASSPGVGALVRMVAGGRHVPAGLERAVAVARRQHPLAARRGRSAM